MPERSSRARFRVQHVARKPRGWRVRTKREGAHELRIAFPPSARRKGSGRLLEILHPKGERNPQCGLAGKNPAELVIFGNPSSSRARQARGAATGAPGHKPGCPCAICKNMRAAGSRLPNADLYEIVFVNHDTDAGEVVTKPVSRSDAKKLLAEMRKTPSRGHYYMKRVKKSGTRAHNKDWNFTPGTSRLMLRTRDKKVHTISRGLSRRDAKRFATELRGVAKRGQTGGKYFVRNPNEMQEAVALYQTFQGRDPAGVIEKQVSAALRMEYTALGDLSYLDVNNTEGQRVRLDFSGDGVKLASAPNGAQLYLIGGRQSLDEKCLAKFTDDTTKDLFDLGEAVEIEYITKKAPSFETTRYYHKFGEEHRGSEMPRATYDALRKQIFLFGGEYRIEAPGIIN